MKTDDSPHIGENFLVKKEDENWVLYGSSFFVKQFTPNLRRIAKKFGQVNLELFYQSLYVKWPWAKDRSIDLEVEWSMGCWHIHVEGRKILIFDPEKLPWKKSRSSTRRSSSVSSKTGSRKVQKKKSASPGSSSPDQRAKKQSGTKMHSSKKRSKEEKFAKEVRIPARQAGKTLSRRKSMPPSQPTKTPRTLGSCPDHPKYQGIRLPRRTKSLPKGCLVCESIYFQKNPESKRKYIRNDLKSLE